MSCLEGTWDGRVRTGMFRMVSMEGMRIIPDGFVVVRYHRTSLQLAKPAQTTQLNWDHTMFWIPPFGQWFEEVRWC